MKEKEIKRWALEDNPDKYRMYGLVVYNLSPIQQGIQFGHGVVEYANENFTDEDYQEWSQFCKTFIILNGGTTNHSFQNNGSNLRKGTLNQHYETLKKMGIKCAYFCEPDLGDQMTAIVFLVEEKIFNRSKFPNFAEMNDSDIYLWNEDYKDSAKEWMSFYENNKDELNNILEMREFLSQFKLA